MSSVFISVGIDVSKRFLDVYAKGMEPARFSNTAVGIAQLVCFMPERSEG